MTTNPPAIPMIECESSQIAAFGYDATSQTLAVRFPGRGVKPGDVYHYAGVPAEVFADMQAAESKGKFFGSHIRGRFDYTKQAGADGVVFGLQQAQEPKFTTSSKDGRIVNRETGKPIPDDEPVFVLRAQDVHALHALRTYAAQLGGAPHLDAVIQRVLAFEAFATANPGRMKLPDTATR